MRRELSPGLAWLAAAGVAAGAGAAWVVGTAGPGRPTVPYAPLALPVALLVGWSFIGSGLLSWRPRAGNWLGPVLVLTGFAWFASMLLDAADPVVFTIGAAVYSLYYAGFLYLILSFPSGRLRGRPERVLMVATIGLVTVGQWAWLLFADSRKFICSTCPANLLEVAREDAATKLIYSVRGACVIAVALAAIALLAGRWRRASRPQRQAVLPVAAAGLLAAAILTAWFLANLMGAASTPALGRAAWYAAAVIPVAVLVVFIRRRLAQGAVAGLVVELGGPGAADLRGALARALGDPSLALAYWFAAESRYVDSGGGPVELPQADTGRRATVIERDGRPVAALIHDPALQYNSTLVESVCAAAGLTLDNERLAAELRARLVELQASRARLVTATDAERRRIERDLHDGAQQQLVALKISLGLARQLLTGSPEAAELLAQTERQAAGALEELRELARGIYPPLLADLGLRAALEAQARKAAVPVTVEAPELGRYPQQTEAAVYFCVLEALQNVAKYAQAPAARVRLGHDGQCLTFTVEDDGTGFDRATTPMGTGLQGIADRMGALGGTIDIVSAPGHGTRVTGRVPAAAR